MLVEPIVGSLRVNNNWCSFSCTNLLDIMHLCNFVPRGTDCFIMGLKDFVFRAQTATLREDVEGGNNSNMLGFFKIVFVLFVCLFVF